MPQSPFREIDSAARAFDQMTTTLRWVETYLPRRLVRQLMRRAEAPPEERAVTVLFTDIIGFTALSEHRTAAEMAQMLNEHFSLVEACIDAEGGTLDKYIGDLLADGVLERARPPTRPRRARLPRRRRHGADDGGGLPAPPRQGPGGAAHAHRHPQPARPWSAISARRGGSTTPSSATR